MVIVPLAVRLLIDYINENVNIPIQVTAYVYSVYEKDVNMRR